MEKRNAVYYRKYPQDVGRVKKILTYLERNDVTLPNGGRLSPDRFLQLGMEFDLDDVMLREIMIQRRREQPY